MSTSSLRNCLELCRVSNLPTVWVNVLAAALLSAGNLSSTGFILSLLSLSLLYCGGMVLNDLCDAAEDVCIKPQRPIPSGRINRPYAALVVTALFTSAMLLLLMTRELNAVGAGAVLLLLIILYDLFHLSSRLAVFLMGSCRFMVYVVAGLATAGRLSNPLLFAASVQSAYIVILTAIARWEKGQKPLSWPLIPVMLSGIPVVDGLMLAILVQPAMLAAGLVGGFVTLISQRKIKGD